MSMSQCSDPCADWRERYRVSRLASVTVANRNPRRGLVCTNLDGIFQLYAWDVDSGELRRLTDRPAGVRLGMLSSDGEYVYYMRDGGGDEIGRFVRVPFVGGDESDVTPGLLPYGGFLMQQSHSGNLLGARVADKTGLMLYVFAPGAKPQQIYQTTAYFVGPSLSCEGDMAVIATTQDTGSSDRRLIALDCQSGECIAELWDGPGTSHGLGRFSPAPGDTRMVSTTSRSGHDKPIIWDPRVGERRDLDVDGLEGNIAAWDWSPDARRILLSQLHQARQRLYTYDLETDALNRLHHPDGVLGGFLQSGQFASDGRVLVTWQDAVSPPRLLSLGEDPDQDPEPVLVLGDAPHGRPWSSVWFETASGETIQGWLASPDGEGPYPTILHVHGGPAEVMRDYYSPDNQAWLDHGFAFLSINYHGSTTFGKDFEKSILGQPGEHEIEDIASAHRWLVAQGIACPEAIFLVGGSYGGYLTLLALGWLPDLWAGGIASMAIADWTLTYEDESDALRSYHRVIFGGSPDETPDVHRRNSPSTYADRFCAPLLVIQGRNDTRTPARQMSAFVERMRSLEKEIEIYWFDAGHGSQAQDELIRQQEMRIRFARGILDAREGEQAS